MSFVRFVLVFGVVRLVPDNIRIENLTMIDFFKKTIGIIIGIFHMGI